MLADFMTALLQTVGILISAIVLGGGLLGLLEIVLRTYRRE